MRLVMASGNAHKAAEIREILSAHMIEQRPSWVGEVDENAETLAGNARLKARAICEATGTAAVADDTGLEVDALGGLPGVRSARFAGDSATDEENLRKLLKSLEAVPSDERGARFRTVAIVAFPDGKELVTEGVANGMIAEVPRGNGGFGYDSLFVPDEGTGLSFAEMSETEKNLISHRGKAFRSLAQLLQS
ncbi:MAG: non-canonical purine NTP pyrophosphatase, RdgB/HAM1 family [Acidimicrobiaceae bacterium]|jgi:XTP/dITP diphosphohydrolase|nr:non-canonical purine NTP pyrophosphatase, RdgB/HAM1 family [Acidimicrobiaceae bacterium]HBV25728.1 non-canonical purine NTP pyrophosphatase, RdgB/HAM1 family [Acidimicrobiaceae bacterium]HCK73773.1 non-canonical purine NTP pyrophosphatase, RdgB/HAM1 family [Acidimicrobiaceae bacterium]|tara:strand:- start:12793 stop:13368 length:576 start_codon:yes stop_codon:yes gene_type:complete